MSKPYLLPIEEKKVVRIDSYRLVHTIGYRCHQDHRCNYLLVGKKEYGCVTVKTNRDEGKYNHTRGLVRSESGVNLQIWHVGFGSTSETWVELQTDFGIITGVIIGLGL